MRKYISFYGLLLYATISFPQQNYYARNIVHGFDDFHKSILHEKVYLHTDKSIYNTSESICFCAYLVDATWHTPLHNTTVYVELIADYNKTLVCSRNIKMTNGTGHGDMLLADSLLEGKYHLRAYTRNMQNYDENYFFHKTVYIHSKVKIAHPGLNQDTNSNQEFQLQFFPEGGNMVTGIACKVAFKATNSDGESMEVEGIIMDNNKRKVCDFKSVHSGMGTFSLIPEKDKRYKAYVIKNNKEYKFKLPESLKKGYQMTIANSSDEIIVSVRNSPSKSMDSCFIIGQCRGEIFAVYEKVKSEKPFEFTALKKDLPGGIIHFTLFDKHGIPWCERLIYNYNTVNSPEEITLNMDTISYKTRKKIVVSFNSNPQLDCTSIENLSLTVAKSDLSNSSNGNNTIHNYLFLISEFPGYIEHPGFYFDTCNHDRLQKLDLLLMTHGWRRFTWQNILSENYPEIKYIPEIGYSVSGQLVNYYDRNKPVKGTVIMNCLNDNSLQTIVETKENGLFCFNGFHLYDTVHIIMNAKKFRKRMTSKKTKIDPVFLKIDHFDDRNTNYSYLNIYDTEISDFQIHADTTFLYDKSLTQIEEVKVISEYKNIRKGALYLHPSRTAVADSIINFVGYPNVFHFLIGRFPGVKVVGIFPNEHIQIGPNTSFGINTKMKKSSRKDAGESMGVLKGALILVDGMYYTDPSILYTIPMSQIKVIDILKPMQAVTFGSYGYNGVVAIYTKPIDEYQVQTDGRRDWGIMYVKHPGYSIAREFYTPVNNKKNSEAKESDSRTTLYWNPSLEIGNNGVASIEFYSADEQSEYCIELEGITKKGQTITAFTRFKTEY